MTKTFVDAIVFDFDGVVVDTVGDITNAANFVLGHYGMPALTAGQVRGLIGGGAEPLVRKMLGERSEELFPEAIGLFKQEYSTHYDGLTCLYPGALALLEALHQKDKRMGIATNKMEKLTHGLIQKLGLSKYFKVVIGPESIQHRKPHPEAVQKVLAGLGVLPQQALMMGDTAADLLSGQAAGTLTCGVTYGYGPREELEATHPDFMIERIEDLLSLIR